MKSVAKKMTKTITTTLTRNVSKTLVGLSLLIAGAADAGTEPFEILEAALKRNAELSQAHLMKVVESNPTLSKEMKVLSAELESIQRSGKAPEVQFKMSQALLSQRKEIINQVFSTARFDEKKYHAEQEKLVGAFNKKSKKKVNYLSKGKLSFSLVEKPEVEEPTAGPEIILSAPFPFQESELNGEGTVYLNKDTGRGNVSAIASHFSKYTNQAGFSHLFETPSDVRRMIISAEIPEVQSFLSGLAFLGGAKAKTQVRLIVEGENRVICAPTSELDAIYIYFIDQVSASSMKNVLIECDFVTPLAGERLVFHLLGRTHVDTGLSRASATVFITNPVLRLRLNPL